MELPSVNLLPFSFPLGCWHLKPEEKTKKQNTPPTLFFFLLDTLTADCLINGALKMSISEKISTLFCLNIWQGQFFRWMKGHIHCSTKQSSCYTVTDAFAFPSRVPHTDLREGRGVRQSPPISCCLSFSVGTVPRLKGVTGGIRQDVLS